MTGPFCVILINPAVLTQLADVWLFSLCYSHRPPLSSSSLPFPDELHPQESWSERQGLVFWSSQGPPVILLSSSFPALPLVNMLRFDTSPALLVFVVEVVQGGTESSWKLLMSISEWWHCTKLSFRLVFYRVMLLMHNATTKRQHLAGSI